MNTRFYNARICPLGKEDDIIDGELWVTGNRIAYIGPPKQTGLIFGRQIDVGQNLILPGFKNAHTHSPLTFLRSYADELPLQQWLHKKIFPMEEKLSEEHVYHLTKLAILEYLTSGITAVFDMYRFQRGVAAASVDCGFRTVLCSPLNDFISSPKEMEDNYNYFADYHELVSMKLGFHAEYTCSRELLSEISFLAHKYKAPVYTHNSETIEEVAGCRERTGMTPTIYLNSLGIYDYGGGGFHCVHMSDEDLEVFYRKGLYVITNPASNLKLASGIAPITQILEKNIPVAIGTDSAASNNCLDFFREMFLVSGLQSVRQKDASAVGASRVLRMATGTGASAMGLKDCDCLAPGKLADLTVIDLKQPNMQPEHNLIKNIVYSGSKSNVQLTMVNGKILYEKGIFHVGTDPAEIYSMANTIIRGMID